MKNLMDEFEFQATEAQENAEYIKEVETEFLTAFCLGNIKQA